MYILIQNMPLLHYYQLGPMRVEIHCQSLAKPIFCILGHFIHVIHNVKIYEQAPPNIHQIVMLGGGKVFLNTDVCL